MTGSHSYSGMTYTHLDDMTGSHSYWSMTYTHLDDMRGSHSYWGMTYTHLDDMRGSHSSKFNVSIIKTGMGASDLEENPVIFWFTSKVKNKYFPF
jgi:hypothetical protein